MPRLSCVVVATALLLGLAGSATSGVAMELSEDIRINVSVSEPRMLRATVRISAIDRGARVSSLRVGRFSTTG